MPADFYSKCRTCLGDSNDNHQLFDYVEENYRILEMLDGIVPQINIKTTQFSNVICQSCVNQLLTSYKFQQLCLDTNNRLHALLGIPLFETQPEQILDPLVGELGFKVKQELEDDCPQGEIPPAELVWRMGADNDNAWRSDTDSCGFNRLKQHTSSYEKKRAYSCELCNTNLTSEITFKAHMLTHAKGEVAIKKIAWQNDSFVKNDCNEIFETQEFSDIHEVNDNQGQDECSELTHCKKFVPGIQDNEVLNTTDKFEEKPIEATEKLLKTIVKEELEIKIFEEFTDDLDDDAEWINKGYEENSENKLVPTFGTKETKNIKFIDTGLAEVEKPKKRTTVQCVCEICGKAFHHAYFLKRHSSVVHSLTRPHECKICKYRFFTANLLKGHMTKHKSEAERNFKCIERPKRLNYPCMVCQHKFRSIKSLIGHTTKTHPEVEKYKCDKCDKVFLLHAHLLEHLNRHKENENLICLICKKEFRYEFQFKEHMNLHTGEIPYICTLCGKIFHHTGSLKKHMRVHNENRYQCNHCGRKLSNSTNLRHHKERHVGLKKYWCSECPSNYCIRSDLIRHEIIYHSNFENLEKSHKVNYTIFDVDGTNDKGREVESNNSKKLTANQCPDCPKCFEKQDSLPSHYKIHTKEDLLMNIKREDFKPGMPDVEKFNSTDKIPTVIVKEEIEIYDQPMDEFDEANLLRVK